MPWTVDMDVTTHATWSSQRSGRELSQAELGDLQGMLSVRGVKEVPVYGDEPNSGPRGPRGGGGRKRTRGMRACEHKKQKANNNEHTEADASMMVNRDQKTSDSMPQRWVPPYHRMALLPQPLGTVIPAPSWYNNPYSEAIDTSSNIHKGATCGLHAVNHLLAGASQPVILEENQFGQVALDANLRD